MKTMLSGMGVLAAVAGLAAGLSGCASTRSGSVPVQNTLLGSRNVIPPPYVRPAEASSGAYPLIPPRGGEAGAIPSEPLPADDGGLAFVPAEAPVFVGGPNADEVIELPAASSEEVAKGVVPEEVSKPAAGSEALPAVPATYTVRRGDTMGAIALAHGVRWQDIAGLNPDVDPNRMRIGSSLQMPVPGVTVPAPVVREATAAPAVKLVAAVPASLPADGIYTVVSGDNLSKLAHRFKIKIADIREWNGLQSDLLQIGQKLKLRADSRAALPPPAKPAAPAEVAPPASPVAIPGLTPPPAEATPAADAAAAAADATAVAAAAAAAAAVVPAAAVPVAGYVDAVISTDEETLENLAKMYATTVAEILRNNPHIKTNADLKRGTTLKIVHY